MAILKAITLAQAQAVAGPSVITRNLDHFLVYTGDDIPQDASPAERTLSVQDFRSRFTDAELAGVVSSADVAVKVLLVKLQTRADVDLADPQIAAGLDLLVSKGLLTAARRAVIGA